MSCVPYVGPEITVVIPTRNGRDRLRVLLESLAQQTLSPERFDVVVAVDGSTDGTEQMLDELSMPFGLTAVRNSRGGAASARNRGAEHASGRFLLFLNDDMIADPGLVAEHLGAQRREGGVIGIGTVALPHCRLKRWTRWRDESRRGYFEGLAAGRPVTAMNCWWANFSLPRELFLAVGVCKESRLAPNTKLGFLTDVADLGDLLNPHMVEEVELGFRLGGQGARLVFVEGAIATEDVRETFRYSLREAESRGAGELVLYALHPAILPHLEVGGGSELEWKLVAVRRVLLALRVPPLVVAALAALAPGKRRSREAYELLYSYCYWRGVRREAPDRETWQRLSSGTTILAYHAIARSGETEGRYRISQRRFRRQMAWLKRLGYRVISLDELIRLRREFRLPPAKTVVITFDDGYTDTLELALPVLERHGFSATCFFPSAAGLHVGWTDDADLNGRELLGLDRAHALLARGSVGAHTRTHVNLCAVGTEEARAEIAGSKAELEAALGVPVTLFSYPFGRHDEHVRRLVREAGFEAACTVAPGPNRPATDPYQLHRFEVHGTDPLFRFVRDAFL